ncbi:MAG: hypothetical protein C0412_16520 [Flavobacterium sp.]|nr:hypothetical protein [Flavobacterium sp.]
MKSIAKNICKLVIIGIFIILFALISAFLVLKNKNQVLAEKQILSRTDYRIFACGEEIFLKANNESLTTKRNGLFAHSKPGSIIAAGMPLNIDDILLTSFFDAAGGTLEFSDEQKDIFRIPTKAGLREFQSGDLCNGKKAKLQVLHHRIETSTKPWSIYSRIMWKYFDHVLTNNYGKVPPGDCFIFIFDSEDVLEQPWPRCASHEKALTNGELILEK